MNRLTILGLGIIALQVGTPAALAQPLPNWKISEICAGESTRGQCEAFEARAMQALSATWGFVAGDIKSSCLKEAQKPIDRSWRELADCVDVRSLKLIDKAAVKTSRTPGEPVPPPRIALPPPAADLLPPPATPSVGESVSPATPAPASQGEAKQ